MLTNAQGTDDSILVVRITVLSLHSQVVLEVTGLGEGMHSPKCPCETQVTLNYSWGLVSHIQVTKF